MNDDIVKALHLCAEKEERFTSCTKCDCPFGETVIDCEMRMKRAAADALSAAYSRIAELEATLQAYKKHGFEPCDYAGIVASDNRAKKALDDLSVLMKECTRLQAANKEAREKAKLWGKGLIEENSEAHVTICAECDFPIPDYGVNTDLQCDWCRTKNRSSVYAPTGPGYCKTALDRKAETFDKLFCGRRK